jgi:hypothetical protein
MPGITIKEISDQTRDSKLDHSTQIGQRDENRLVFGPDCDNPCFLNKEECKHPWHKMELNKVGEYVAFPSSW